MVHITFYGGVAEIGGNKILVEDGRSRAFLDFGKSFGQEKLYFEEPFLSAREIEHLKVLRLIPHIEGIYEGDKEDYRLDGVLVSHPHMDHYDAARTLKKEYPIYSSEIARMVILAREWASSFNCLGNFGQLNKILGRTSRENMLTLSHGREAKIGDMSASVFPVDHSIPGAVGTIVETSSGNIAYTGDIRFHGGAAEDTERFVEEAARHDPEILITEGTHIDDFKVESEEEVRAKIADTLSRSSGLAVAGFSFGDTRRLRTFLSAAKENGRKLVIPLKQAFITRELHSVDPKSSIDIEDPDIGLFAREKKRLYEFEKCVLEDYPGKMLSKEDIREDQRSLLLLASLYDMNDIAKIGPGVGSIYIHSSSEPFEEEMEISYQKLHNWLDYLGMPLVQIHASGHANPFELKEMIRQISPKKVIPIHTKSPDLFRRLVSDLDVEVILPVKGSPIEF
ncbi:MAG TPA: MBL fold metallo-hydrolase [Euryarchaeota archaeon]|nr:MBL fold metallo-hydrolase [Euryarchaeota archaeon]